MSDLIKGFGNLLSRFGRGPEVSDSFSRTFGAGEAAAVVAHDSIGNIRVMVGTPGAIVVEATKKARGITTEATSADLDAIHVDISQDGNTVRVDAHFDRPATNFDRQLWCDLLITVPADTSLDLKAEAGNVEVTGTSGPLTARLDAGNLTATDVNGPLAVTVSAGNVEVSGVSLAGLSRLRVHAGQVTLDGALTEGATLDVRVDAGRIRLVLPAQTSAHFEASAEAGAVRIAGWSVPVLRNVTAARAEGDLAPNPRGAVTAHVDLGDISLSAR